MKKFFAFMSTLLLTLAFVGLFTKSTAVAADGEKWTVDPTLAEDEIPMYIMGSIYTTFPNYYDNAAKPDELWGGSARMYPWNEVRLRVAEYDAQGNATGKYYAIYFSGSTTAVNSAGVPIMAAGANVNVIGKNSSGQVTLGRVKTDGSGDIDYGTGEKGMAPMDPSLSHVRVNVAGEDVAFDGLEISQRFGDGNGMNFYNRVVVFDGEGRIVRGTGTSAFHQKAGVEGAPADVWAPEFCYVDGEVTKYEEGVTTCDKAKVQAKDPETGEPLYEEDGVTPIMVETDEDDFLYKRFVWEWFEEEPANVNTASYLSEGWDCDLWDYCFEADGGYMCVAFLNGEGTNHRINDNEREITNTTRVAAGEAEIPAGDHYRECVRELRVPTDGGVFDFGYLDNMVAAEAAKFNNLVRGGYLKGRYQGEDPQNPTVKNAEVRTYNFSTGGLKTLDVVRNGNSYQLLEGKNVVEVMKGASFKPSENVIYEAIASMWQRENDITSYSKDLNALEYSMYVNDTMVVFKYPYKDKKDMVAAFEEDVRKWFAPGTAAGGAEGKFQDFTVADTEAVGWDFISTSYNANCFWANAANREKWVWMINYVAEVRKANGLSASHWETIDQGFTASPGTFNAEVSAFLNDTIKNPGAWNRTSDYRVEGPDATPESIQNATGFLPKLTNQESFLQYEINTADDWIDKTYDVKFEVKNQVGGAHSFTIRYVVTDVYTPILKVNKDTLFINPTEVDGKVVVDAIDPTVFVNAYNAKYNGKDIRGDEITHNVHFTSDTLDFAKPVEGTHVVKAAVYTDAKHYAEKQFTVQIADITAPYAEFYDKLVLPYGTTWAPELLVKRAVDNVDGDLTRVSFEWCVDESSSRINTTKPGTYKAKVSVWDLAGNSVASKNVEVVVLEANATSDDVNAALDDKLASLQSALEDLGLSLTDIQDAIDELPADSDVETILAKIAELKESTNAVKDIVSEKGCKKSANAFEFLAAGCLLVFLLRKKH